MLLNNMSTGIITGCRCTAGIQITVATYPQVDGSTLFTI